MSHFKQNYCKLVDDKTIDELKMTEKVIISVLGSRERTALMHGSAHHARPDSANQIVGIEEIPSFRTPERGDLHLSSSPDLVAPPSLRVGGRGEG